MSEHSPSPTDNDTATRELTDAASAMQAAVFENYVDLASAVIAVCSENPGVGSVRGHPRSRTRRRGSCSRPPQEARADTQREPSVSGLYDYSRLPS